MTIRCFLTNTRKTVAVWSAPPKGLANSFLPWRRAAAPFALTSILSLTLLSSALAQSPPAEIPPETEPGIPVTDKLTVEKCGSCHAADEKGNLTRISWIRTTPEGWEQAVKRMVRLNGVTLSPEDARHIVAYLADEHGVAPEEVADYRWLLEKRMPQAEFTPNAGTKYACASCHAFARPMTWRRSATEWRLLVDMHLGYFPDAQFASFHAFDMSEFDPNAAPPTPAAPGQPNREPVDDAIDFLIKNNPLHTAAWSSWRASMKTPDLKGNWVVTGTSPGKGKYFGHLTITADSLPGKFKTETTLTRVADGSKIKYSGQSEVYGGYEWRGSAAADGGVDVRQVMAVSPDQSKIEGRWFWGGYQAFGIELKAVRASADVTVIGTDVTSIHAGSKSVPVKIMGEQFPKDLAIGDLDLGSGVHVTKITASKPTEIDVLVDVDSKLVSGSRGITVKGRTAAEAFSVYDKVDYIKVSDPTALAHLGGGTHPKGYVQFEAIGYSSGLDGKPNTADDINLGPVQVKWSMEEFVDRFNDDDKEFCGSISQDGLFTPAGEGPNPQRRFGTNNTGSVWVVATYQDQDTSGKPLKAQSYLAVTVPLYMVFDQAELGK